MKSRLACLSTVAAVLTFLLIILGGIVRVSDSGLGCGPSGSGTHGWPLCDGRVVPLLDSSTLIEYSHRLLAGLVAIAAVLLLVYVWRRMRDNRRALVLAAIAVASVLVQAVLGGLTVEGDLGEALVAAHLGLAMLLLAMFIGLRNTATGDNAGTTDGGRLFKALTALMVAAVLATIVAGGYVAGTEGHGRDSFVKGSGAHLACGKEFPTCQGEIFPFGTSRPVDIQLTHRLFMYLASVLILALFAVVAASAKYRRMLPIAVAGVCILLFQVLLGAINVWVGEKGWLVIAHLSVGTILWAWSVQFALKLIPVSETTVNESYIGERARAGAAV